MNSYDYKYRETPELPAVVETAETGVHARLMVTVDTGAEGGLLDDSIAQMIGIDLSASALVGVQGLSGTAGACPRLRSKV